MAPHLTAKAPQCLLCIRRVTRLGDSVSLSAGQQIRGKKKLAKISSVDVQLLQNVPGYGRRGSVVPVTRGVMRNTWFPRKIAEYANPTKLKELAKADIATERDPTFGSKRERKAARAAGAAQHPAPTQATSQARLSEDSALRIELPHLSPQGATDIMSKLLPPNIDFYRTPIPVDPPKPEQLKRVSPSIPTTSAISAAAAAAQPKEVESKEGRKIGIYGSVSTSDIAANLQAVLAETYSGAPLVLSPESISIVGQTEERSRIKHLGIFEIEIRLSGAVKPIRRTITVSAQE